MPDVPEIPFSESEAGLPGVAPGEWVPTPGSRHRGLRALRHPQFRFLFGASLFGDAVYWVSFIALQAEMADITGKSPGWLGVLYFANFIPMLLFAPVAGVVADRFDRRRILITVRLAVAVIGAALATIILGGLSHPAPLLGLAACLGTAYAFIGPAQSAAIANSVPDPDLLSAVSTAAVGNNLSRVAGPALAAPILALGGNGGAFVVYAASSLVVALLLVPVRLHSQFEVHDDQGTWARWVDGLRHARERPPAMAALLTMAVFSIFGGAQAALYPVFAHDAFDRPTRDFTLIVMASGIGAVIGAVANGLRSRVPGLRSALVLMTAFSAATLGFASSRQWWLGLACTLAVGFCYFSMTTALNTLLQHLADDEKRGRMMSLFVVTWGGIIPVGALAMGSLASATSAPTAVGAGACVCLAYAIGQLVRLRLRPGQASMAPLR